MSESLQVAVAAASLTAEEVAACYRRGVAFTDLAILVVAEGESCGRAIIRVADALKEGAFMVWLLDPVCSAITIYPSWTHLQVVRADAELAMPELPHFQCRIREFFRLLGLSLPPTA
jgi:hypothetical protein